MSDRHTCFPLKPLLVGTNVPNIVLNIAILITPLREILQMKVPWLKKFLLCVVLLLGAL